MRKVPRAQGGHRWQPVLRWRGYWRGKSKPRRTALSARLFVPAAILIAAILDSLPLAWNPVWPFEAKPAFAGSPIAGRASVIDGDTIEIHGQRIRLHGIDAPESGQTCNNERGSPYRCGQRAALALSNRIGVQSVACEPRDIDGYERVVAVCRAGGEDLNAWLVSVGWAIAYRQYSTDYVDVEDAARTAKRGLWVGTFMPPEEWRRARDGSGPSPNADQKGPCLIKGNVSSKGERVYHMPGGTFYDKTRIDRSKGERMFCSEAEAQAAGWRRSKR